MAFTLSLPSPRQMLPALFLLGLSANAGAQTAATCLTESEAQNLVLYALPAAADQLGQSCAASLPATAYLVRSRGTLTARFVKSAGPVASGARIAFAKIAGVEPEKFAKLDDKVLRDLIGIGITSAMANGIKAGDCRIINDVLEQLDPLPPENLASLVGIALRESGRKPTAASTPGAKPNPFRICGAEQGL